MKTGVVKFYDETKRFGFIKADTGEDIFVHSSGLKQAIKENDKVTFETETGKKGVNAVNVRVSND